MPDLIGRLLPPRRSARWDDAVEAIRRGAAYLAQGASYSYLRARTLLAGPRLFSDDDFAFALNICKWEGFAVAGQDLILIFEADMREALPEDVTRRAAGLSALYAEVLAREPAPPHRTDRDWQDAKAEFAARLPVFLSRPPLKPDAISIATALRLLDHAPIEESVRRADQMMVVNNTAFRFIDYQARLRREIDLGAFAAEMSRRIEEAA